jgi:hypothetical protein
LAVQIVLIGVSVYPLPQIRYNLVLAVQITCVAQQTPVCQTQFNPAHRHLGQLPLNQPAPAMAQPRPQLTPAMLGCRPPVMGRLALWEASPRGAKVGNVRYQFLVQRPVILVIQLPTGFVTVPV